jgi:hypothetical protein
LARNVTPLLPGWLTDEIILFVASNNLVNSARFTIIKR